jgi:putative ABC transport system permease protein
LKYAHLVWAALARNKGRTALTLVSVVMAFLLFGLLESVQTAFVDAGRSVAAASRLMTVSRISMTVPLPLALYHRIASVPGVADTTYASWFGGIYQDPRNFFDSDAVAGNFFDLYPEFELSAAARRAFSETRTGAIAGASLAARLHWKIGDRIPLQASIFPQKSGSNTWTFDLVGLYRVADPRMKSQENAFFFHWRYFDEARAFGNGQVGWYVEKVSNPAQADSVARAVDAISINSDHETTTESENAYTANFIRQYVDIGLLVGSIMGGVFFSLILVVGNIMAQAVRERIPELAILKVIGFRNGSLLALTLAESVMMLTLGGCVGLALAAVAVAVVRARLGVQIPMLPVGGAIWLHGIVLMTALGLLVGALPAWRGMTIRVVDALCDG